MISKEQSRQRVAEATFRTPEDDGKEFINKLEGVLPDITRENRRDFRSC